MSVSRSFITHKGAIQIVDLLEAALRITLSNPSFRQHIKVLDLSCCLLQKAESVFGWEGRFLVLVSRFFMGHYVVCANSTTILSTNNILLIYFAMCTTRIYHTDLDLRMQLNVISCKLVIKCKCFPFHYIVRYLCRSKFGKVVAIS